MLSTHPLRSTFPHRRFRPIFLALLTAIVGLGTLGTTVAHAQTQTAVVLDFAVAPGLDPLLGRKAGDSLAVELARSGDYEIVTRQRLEEAVGSQAGLHPPYNDTTQIRLAQTVGARSVISGKVVAVAVGQGSVQAQINVRQLDSRTGDYINGTQILEAAEQALLVEQEQVLLDEAINKAAFAAVRSMKQTTLPGGTVLNTTIKDVEVSIGAQDGVVTGQRYSLLRDVYNRAKQITERVKIGEVRITRVESDQATAVLSAGGRSGIRTGDHIRLIYEPKEGRIRG